jgi:hypothetical protein
MRILLYNPANGVTANFMPHLWTFLLQAGHEVLLIDGNTQPMSYAEIVCFVLAKGIGLVEIGAMTRMIAKAYRVTPGFFPSDLVTPSHFRARTG